MVRSVMPDAPVDSWRLVFDPSVAVRFAKCGIAMIDSNDLVWLARAYLGQRVDDHSEQDMKAAETLLLSIRPYVRMIDNARYKSALADGEVCIAIGWSGDIQQAQARAEEAGRGPIIKYSIPKEGSVLWVDMMAIPIDAPHVDEAYAFLDFMQRPEVAAANTNFNSLAKGNQASDSMIEDRIRHNEAIYPAAETMDRLFTYGTISPEYDRQLNRSWTRFRTGR
jgi:putrescine transport system substrate-binding protein